MSKAKKLGIIFVLVGIGLSLVSFFSASYYEPGAGLIYNIRSMAIILLEERSFVTEWKYMTAKEAEDYYKVYCSPRTTDIRLGPGKYISMPPSKHGPHEIAVCIKGHKSTDISVEAIEKAIISGEKIRIAVTDILPPITISYRAILIICILLVFIGIGLIVLSRDKKEVSN